MTATSCTDKQHAVDSPCASTDGEMGGGTAELASKHAVLSLWKASWAGLRAAFPDLEVRLAVLEHDRPTRARALRRLESSAGRAAGRCLRGEVAPGVLLQKLLAWEQAILTEFGSRKGGAQ
jgi:hypothetical protein